MKLKKRQLILAMLIIALGAAVYLNWQFADNGSILTATTQVEGQDSSNSEKALGDTTYVNTNADQNAQNAENSSQDNKDNGMTPSATEYFSSARLARKQARDNANETLKTTIDNPNATDDVKKSAVDESAKIAANIEAEANIESMVKAKGFKDCMAYVENNQCTVNVFTTGLLDSEAIIIKDIVSSQTGVSSSNIKIVEVK